MILCIETATAVCSVALCNSSGVVSLKESSEGRSHASLLTVFIDELLKKEGIKTSDLEAVAVSKGPGSYTGLRIGVSTAKGLSYAAGIPLIGIETTFSMYNGFINSLTGKYKINNSDLFCPALDARRMEIYYSLFDATGNQVRSVRAEIMNENTFIDVPSASSVYLFGDGAEKCRDIFSNKNVVIIDDFKISAASMQKPAYDAFTRKSFEDVAYFEPFYLKDFLISKPARNILGI